jgi:hypothetical protein
MIDEKYLLMRSDSYDTLIDENRYATVSLYQIQIILPSYLSSSQTMKINNLLIENNQIDTITR